MKFIRTVTIIILILLLISTIILLMFQNIVSLAAVTTGGLLLYYMIVLTMATFAKNEDAKPILKTTTWILFLIPIVWGLLDPASLFELGMSNFHMDMK